jgi:hypothetical protein
VLSVVSEDRNAPIFTVEDMLRDKPASLLFASWLLLGLFFDPHQHGTVPHYTASHPKNSNVRSHLKYVGVLISLWLFLFHIFVFAAQPKEFSWMG